MLQTAWWSKHCSILLFLYVNLDALAVWDCGDDVYTASRYRFPGWPPALEPLRWRLEASTQLVGASSVVTLLPPHTTSCGHW